MDAGRRWLVQTEALLGCTIVRALRSPGPHMGVGMEEKPPLTVLKELGYNGDEAIALFPPIILDWISADLILSCDKEVGNDLLAHYIGKDNE
jgi:hypothetical protein